MDRQLLPKPQEQSEAGSPVVSPDSPLKPKRRKENVTPVACDECKRKKSKCDGGKPGCKRCSERGVECVYNTVSSSQKVAVFREKVKELESEVKRLRFENILVSSGSRKVPSNNMDFAQPNTIDNSIPMPDSTNQLPLGTMLQDVVASGKGVYIHEDHRRENAFIETHRIMPYSSFDDEESVRIGCTQFYRECRQALARGAQLDQILGDPVLDVSGIVHSENLPASHPFSKWAVMFTLSNFGQCSWELQLAKAYFSFYLMRWMVFPSEENFDRLPEFAKPTLMQRWVPHPFWMDFIIMPEPRDAFIKYHTAFGPVDWLSVFERTQIAWLENTPATIQLNPTSTHFNLSPAFEATIRDIRNWVFPTMLDIVNAPEQSSPTMDLTDSVVSTD